jgi:hypothetical protein
MVRRRSGLLFTMICMIGAVFLAQNVLAAGNIQIGQIKVLPRVNYKGEWESNIYQTKDDEKSDYLHHIGAGLGLDYTRDKDNYLRIGYDAVNVRYSEYDKNNYWKHNVLATAGYKSPIGFYALFSERFNQSSDPYDNDDAYSTDGDITKRWTNDAKLGLGFEFSDRIRTEVYYKNYIKEFHSFSDKHKDRMEHSPGIIGYYKFMPKTSALFEYRATFTKYTEQESISDNAKGYDDNTSQDSTYHRFFVGLHWDATAKITGDLKLGWGYKDYDNDKDNNGNDYDDDSTWIAETRLAYQLFQKTSLRFRLLREDKDDTNAQTSGYEHTKVGIGFDQGITDQLKVVGDFDYTLDTFDYDAKDDNDVDIYNAKIGLNYDFNEWLGAGIAYNYRDKSNSAGWKKNDDYTDHICSFNVGARF